MNLHEINHLVKSKVGKHITKDVQAFSILYAPADFSFYVHMEKAKGPRAHPRFQVEIPGISFLFLAFLLLHLFKPVFSDFLPHMFTKTREGYQFNQGSFFKLG